MTQIWGPLGWMTLHSISVGYPEFPSEMDKRQLNLFMDAFGNSITCVFCRDHFSEMFKKYKSSNPRWNSTRYNLFLAICRMHNSVNKRLDKPSPKSVEECLSVLKNATSVTSQMEFREKYFSHVIRNWRSIRDHSAFFALRNAEMMKQIHDGYWKNYVTSYDDLKFPESDVNGFNDHVIYKIPNLKGSRLQLLNFLRGARRK
jgi:hypothetical protein